MPESSLSPRETALREGHRIWAEIDLDRLAANVRNLNQRSGDARLLAVVKGNAYGHGAVPVARTALEAGAWGLGVVSLEEGEQLRSARIDAPILVLGSSAIAQARRLVAARLSVTVATDEMGEALSAAAVSLGRQAIVHIKVETGLNRFGVLPDEAVALAQRLRALPNLTVEGVSTHLASVDEGDKTFTHTQYAEFRRSTGKLPWVPLHHISSTGAVLDLPDLQLGLVRCGIGIYGYYPSDEVSRSVELQPVLSLRSRVARVSDLEAGASVGYGRTWTAEHPSRVALVLAGYGDGIRRNLSNRGTALVRGQRVPYAGRVAMDMLMLDITDVPAVAVDDEVTLIGEQQGEVLTAADMARDSGTISYEVLTGIMTRVPRAYVRGGQIVAWQDLTGYHEA